MLTLYSIGHSVRPMEDFLSLLKQHGIRQLADIRSIPRSRRHPQFCDQSMAQVLAEHGIAYRHFPDLGGKRQPKRDSRNDAFRAGGGLQAYADHMATPAFERALQELMQWAEEAPTAMMCAEAKPSECHRQLTGDALSVRGVEVRHITGLGTPAQHQLHARAMLLEGKLLYPATQGTLF